MPGYQKKLGTVGVPIPNTEMEVGTLPICKQLWKVTFLMGSGVICIHVCGGQDLWVGLKGSYLIQ